MQVQKTEGNQLIGLLRGAFKDTSDLVIPIFSEDITVIGSIHTCNLYIKHGTISPVHATIYAIEHSARFHNVVYIRDDSDNGTFINNRPIDKGRSAILFPGCVVSFALQAFSFYFIPVTDPSEHTVDMQLLEHLKINTTREISIYHSPLEFGGEGMVCLAIPNDESGYQMVCKMRKTKGGSNTMRYDRHCRHELSILQQLHHPNVVKLLHHHKTEQGLYYFFTPLSGGGDLSAELAHLRNKSTNMPMERVKHIFLQLVKAVHYLHNFKATDDNGNIYQRPIIHRDIKVAPENILLHARAEYPRVILTDFGSAIYQDEIGAAPEGGTVLYLGPEMLGNDTSLRGTPADVWSLGLVLYEMISGEKFFADVAELNSVSTDDIQPYHPKFNQPVWKTKEARGALNLLRGMLNKLPNERPTTTQLLSADWIYRGSQNLGRGRAFREQFENEVAVWEGRERKMYPAIGYERAAILERLKDPERLIFTGKHHPVAYETIKKITGYSIYAGTYEDGVPMATASGSSVQIERAATVKDVEDPAPTAN